MKTQPFAFIFLFLFLINCAATNHVIYDYNLDADFNQYDTYVLCIEDFTVEHIDNPKLDNENIRQLIGDAVAIEMENKAHKTNVIKPQLQAGFTILISKKTATFQNCEYYKDLEYWESCRIEEHTYNQETLMVYVADFKSNEVLWHASIVCNLNKSKKRLKSYINELVKILFNTYPKAIVVKNLEDSKTF